MLRRRIGPVSESTVGYALERESNDQAVQLRILKDTLRSLEDIDQPGTIVDLPYEWV